jgi:acetyl esterase/lipase
MNSLLISALKILASLMLFTVLFEGRANAQQTTLTVWDGNIPGAINNPTYQPETIFINDNVPRLTKVTSPTLDVYLPRSQNPCHSAIIVCPGGGYGRLAVDVEGSLVAAWLNELGITVFVLKYRLPSDAIMVNKTVGPLQDAQEAIRKVRSMANQWNLNRHKIGIMGFSAGGHLAATLSTHFDQKVYDTSDTTSARPDFTILVYPVISMDSAITHRGSRTNLLGEQPSSQQVERFSNELQVTSSTPPTFMVHATDDTAVPVLNSVKYLLALKKSNIPAELHIYESGGHGFGLGKSKRTESSWPEACQRWLQMHGIL